MNGFYKLDSSGAVLYGPNFVENADYMLTRETKEQFNYPVDGWYWFNSEEEAYAFFGINREGIPGIENP